MGTRADFYIGTNKDAEWLGSIAWDGYPSGIADEVLNALSEPYYRDALKLFFDERNDVTLPEHGWPWPWEDSRLTDCVYAWSKEHRSVLYSTRKGWIRIQDIEKYCEEEGEGVEILANNDFPNMEEIQNVQIGGKRSGLVLVGVTKKHG